MPSQVLLFADIVDTFVIEDKDKILNSIKHTVILLCYIGGAIWLLSYLYFTMLATFSERVANKIRVEYFKSILRQEVAWMEK